MEGGAVCQPGIRQEHDRKSDQGTPECAGSGRDSKLSGSESERDGTVQGSFEKADELSEKKIREWTDRHFCG